VSTPTVPILVSQKTSAATLGLPPKTFLRIVRERGIRHSVVHRLVLVRLDDLLQALGLTEAPTAAPEPTTDWRASALCAIRGGRR
jgi:hypothetical protein